LSCIDIIFYFEIYACFYLDEYVFPVKKFYNLKRWMDEMMEVPEISDFQMKFEESADKATGQAIEVSKQSLMNSYSYQNAALLS